MHVLVNAANVTAAGPRSLVLSLLPALLRATPDSQFTILLPEEAAFRSLLLTDSAKAIYVAVESGISNELNRLRQLFWDIPQLAQRVKADVCLTLGDLGPIRLSCPHVVFLHSAYFVYSHKELNGKSWLLPKRLYLAWHFRYSLHHAVRIVVQTPVMAERLARRYTISREKIVELAQPVPQHVVSRLRENKRHPQIVACGKRNRLLFLAAYYAHKNHAILPAVAEELRRRGMVDQVHIFVTLSEAQNSSANIRRHLQQYPDIFTNLGGLQLADVASALRASTALFLPSLVETYGLMYLEAMASGLPILTSDRDFARWMCSDLALYFDPLDPSSIVDAIESLSDLVEDATYTERVWQRMNELPRDWNDVARRFLAVLKQSAMKADI